MGGRGGGYVWEGRRPCVRGEEVVCGRGGGMYGRGGGTHTHTRTHTHTHTHTHTYTHTHTHRYTNGTHVNEGAIDICILISVPHSDDTIVVIYSK